jgi:N-terminal domain of anti-restriction factor ArdC/Resolvase, N terminal domain/Helix-turn-helix domain of resolvase
MKRDLYTEVSSRIVAELERGAAPWIKPWSATPGQNVPQNAVSNRPYSGCNVILLFRSMADPWADTTTPHGRLMLTVLGGLAEFERELIRARTDEGRKRAMTRGVRFWRKPKLTPHQVKEAVARREAGEPLVEIGRSYNVSHSTISRL